MNTRLFSKWLIAIFLSTIFMSANGQVFYTEDFESGFTGWTANVGSPGTSITNSCVGSSLRQNLYSFADTMDIYTPIGTSLGDSIRVQFEYKIIDWSFPNPATTDAFGTFEFQVGSSATGPWTTVYTLTPANHTVSSTCATVAAPAVSFPAGSAFFRVAGSWNAGDYYLYLDNILIFEGAPITCTAPSNLNTINISSTMAQGVWNSNGPGTSFELELGAPGFTIGSGIRVTNVTDTFYVALGLSPNTSYDWYVREICGSGDTSFWSGPNSFTTNYAPFSNPTPCGIGVPIVDFVTVNVPITVSGSGNSLGTNAIVTDINLIMNHSFRGDLDVFLISPNGVRVELFTDIGGGADDFGDTALNCSGVVNLNMLASSSITTFTSTTVKTGSFIPEGDFASFNDGSNPNGIWILEVSDDAGGDQGAVQFVEIVVQAPPTCPNPTALTLDSANTTNAFLSWVAGGTETSWQIEYGAPGFTQGSGNFIIAGTNPYTLSNLMPATAYDVYLRAICGIADSSLWVGPLTVQTSIQAASGVNCTSGTPFLVFSEDFEVDPPSGWIGTFTGNGGQWDITAGNTNSTGTGPSASFSGSNHLEFEASGANGTVASAISPAIDLSATIPGTEAELSFWMHAFGGDMGTLTIGVSTSQTGPFTPEFTWSGELQTNATDPWQSVGVDLSSYIGQIIYIEIKQSHFTTGFEGDMSIDLMQVNTCVACVSPTNIIASAPTSNSIDVSWTASGSASNWEVNYGFPGFTPGSGTTVAAASDSITVSGLMANTIYEFYVRAICAPGDTSIWLGPASNRTLCGATSISGVVTIDAGSAPSATNFTSFSALADELNICGIGGALTVNVVANSGPYNERFVLGKVAGSSSVNTITLNGNGNTLSDSTTVSAERATILLSGTDYLTINDLTIEALGTSAFGVHLTDTANFNTINNCVININPTSTSTFTGGIVLSNSLTSATSTGDISSNNTFSNNIINGGYYGVVMMGSSTTVFGTGNKVLNNQINDFYQSGVRTRYQEDVEVIGNDINRANRSNLTSFYGFYVEDETFGGLFADNKIHDNATQDGTNTSLAYPIYFISANGSPAKPVRVQNNTVYNINGNGTTYGAYFTTPGDDIQFYHNTILLDNLAQTGTSAIYGLYHTGPAVNFDHKNNIIQVNNSNTGTHFGVYFSNAAPGVSSNNNVVSVLSPNTAPNFGRLGTAVYADLAAWQVGTTQDANSTDANPVFTSSSTGNLTPLNAAVDNIGTPVGVLTDINGAARSITTPDAGAYEFTGISSELGLSAGSLIRGFCYSSNDSVSLTIDNLIGGSVDFSVNNLVANWSVSGPKNSGGTINLNSGIVGANSSIIISASGVDMSLPGTYTLSANIQPNAINIIAANDSISGIQLTVNKIVSANPSFTVLTNTTDSIELKAGSGLFPNGGFFITEVCQFGNGGTGQANPYPSYMSGTDDYIEITGAPFSDLGGFTLEQWSTTVQNGNYTFPGGTVLNSQGTAIIRLGVSGIDDPSNAQYFVPSFSTTASSTATGRLLKDAFGNIMDAVGYSGSTVTAYNFPAAAGVSASDWSNSLLGGSGTAGIRLQGADVNSGTNWIVVSGTQTQDPNTANGSVTVPVAPSVPNFEWTLNGTSVSTNTSFFAGPFATSGVREYVAVYNDTANCGFIYDTAVVDVQLPINDSCALAFEITSNGIYTCNPITSGGTANHPSAVNANWFYFDAPSNGEILVSACGSLVDTRLWIMTGTCGATVDVAADDDGCGANFESIIQNFPVTGGTRYYIQWDDRWSSSGFDFEFNFNSCLSPTGFSASNVTATSVDINFTSTDTVQFEWGPFGFTQGAGTFINNATSPVNLSGLTPATLYQFYIRQLCASGDTSAWIGPVGFSSGLPACTITQAPSGVDGSGCLGSTVDLTATLNDPNNNLSWFNTVGGTQIATGSPFTTPSITGNSTYYVGEFNGTGGVQAHVGPAAPTGTLTFPGGNFSNGQWFTVLEPLTIDSMTLVVNGALDGSIVISDDDPSTGGIALQSFNYSLPGAGTFQIPVGIVLDAGNYFINLGGFIGTGVLFRSTAGANYPSYEIPGVVSIDSSDFGGGAAGARYYYFWDWVVNSGCTGPLDTVNVTALPQPGADFSFVTNNLTADFTAIVSSPDSVAWDFGDGNFGSGLTPSNTYASVGNYNVTMTAYLNGCDSSITQQVSVSTGLVNTLNQDVNIYPNPTNGQVVIRSEGIVFNSIEIFDMLGNVVFREDATFETQKSIEIGHLSNGNYLIRLVSKDGLAIKRLMLSK